MKRQMPAAAVIVALAWCTASAQGLGGLLNKAKEAKGKIESKKADDSSKTDDSKKDTPPPQAAEQKQAATESATTSGDPGNVGGQPDLKAVTIDFVPGEKTIFFDDFSDMAPDEPPPHWKVRGGTVELRMGGAIRELYSKTGPELTSPPMAVPQNFTAQAVMTGDANRDFLFRAKDDHDIFHIHFHGHQDGKGADLSVSGPGGALGESGDVAVDLKGSYELDFWAQQGRVRVYFNGHRVVDVNQVQFPPIDHLFIADQRGYDAGLRSVRVAESAPDPGSILASTGKYVTHGIYFDTNSDRVKPESAPVIKQIAAALIKNPTLKLEIDGYTDATGDPGRNLDLSKRRAQAVRSILVSQFGIDQPRLTSNGFGADKPIASNDTPDGRAQNRRVEFVKQ